MLDALRRGAGTWVAKIFLGILVLSFAVWGVADIFTGYRGNTLVTVGDTEIDGEYFRYELQNEMQQIGRNVGRPLTMEEARALGVDSQVLGRMITEAAFDERAREMGLGMSDDAVAESIRTDPAFQTPGGVFDRGYFDQVLRATGQSEAAFVANRRAMMLRQAIGNATTSGTAPSQTVQEAVHAYANETRSMDYFVLGIDSIEEVEEPTDGALEAYFETNKSRFAAPEFRGVTVLAVNPETVAETIEISEQELQDRFEQEKDRLSLPERRTVNQIVFSDATEAQAARDAITGGKTFEDVAQERGLSADQTSLGTVARSDIVDPAVAEAAFALEQDVVSDVVEGQFGAVLVKVTDIQAGTEQTFEAVRDALLADMRTRRAEDRVLELYDEIEDSRAAGQTLSEVSTAKGLSVMTFEAVDARGQDRNGDNINDLPARDALVRDIFESDVGIENDPLQLRGTSFVWFEVTDREEARERTLDEVRDRVAEAWKRDTAQSRLERVASEAVTAINNGDPITAVSGRNSRSVTSLSEVSRSTTSGPIGAVVVQQLFLLAQGKAAQAQADNGEDIVVFQMTGSTVPPADAASDVAEATYERLAQGKSNDLLAQYATGLREQYGVEVNAELLRYFLGEAPHPSQRQN